MNHRDHGGLVPISSLAIALTYLALSSPLVAQQIETPPEDTYVKSMGFPVAWKPYLTAMVAWERRGQADLLAPELDVGVFRGLSNPLMSPLGVVGEGYVKYPGGQIDGGLRLLAASRFFYLQAGLDYSFRYKNTDFLLGVTFPLRRGGPFGRGGNVRIDWLPGRDNSFNLGVSIPIGQPNMGKTRPHKDYVSLPKARAPDRTEYVPSSVLGESLGNIRDAAEWISRFTTPFLDRKTNKDESAVAEFTERLNSWKTHIRKIDQEHPEGHSFTAEVEFYHRELERAFALALRNTNNDAGGRLAAQARHLLLHEVILPYNRLLGQRKRHDSVLGYGRRATDMFERWVRDSSAVPAADQPAVMFVFHSLIQYLDDSREYSKSLWNDSRLIWLPFHYALRFEDHDTEDELDALIELAVEHEFIEANDVHYVLNELFQTELERMIRAAEDYHVLWVHDIRGYNAAGAPDSITYRLCVETYLQTLLDRVRAYDKTGKIPVYMILLDQHYFEVRKSKMWLELLANPLDGKPDLPSDHQEWTDSIRSLQAQLKQAVEQSPALQAAVRQHGRGWLKNKIKVHVNITNPADFSFRSRALIKGLPLVPDNLMRDHRKIAFYDVTERDPGKGEALYTGMGIGEHYLGSTWDDRSILVRGPALVALKDDARTLLQSQGFDDNEIPGPLKPLPRPEDYAARVQQLQLQGWTASALQVHNVTGYGPKPANLVKAILYNCMPNGSHMYVPDALWLSPYWGSMLVGAALRGCVVLVISPSLANAPSSGAPQMSLANELFTRFVIIQNEMKDEFESAGGMFKVGIYDVEHDVGDLVGKVQKLYEVLAHNPQFRRVFPFDTSIVELVSHMPAYLAAQGLEPTYLANDKTERKPKLHLKSQFFASERTIQSVIPLKGWRTIMEKYLMARIGQVTHAGVAVDAKSLRASLREDVDTLYDQWRRSLPEEHRAEAILYLTCGSHNQDYRSMVMDGEALFVVGRIWSLIGYLDHVVLVGQTTWLENQQQLEELLPAQTGFWRWLGHFMKLAL